MLEEAPVRPVSERETKLARIWAEVLQREAVGLHDDYFDLGGNSLLAVSLFTRIEKQFGAKLPLTSVIEVPNVKAPAAHVGREVSGETRIAPTVVDRLEISSRSRPSQLLVVSAMSRDALDGAAERLAEHLKENAATRQVRAGADGAGAGEPASRVGPGDGAGARGGGTGEAVGGGSGSRLGGILRGREAAAGRAALVPVRAAVVLGPTATAATGPDRRFTARRIVVNSF